MAVRAVGETKAGGFFCRKACLLPAPDPGPHLHPPRLARSREGLRASADSVVREARMGLRGSMPSSKGQWVLPLQLRLLLTRETPDSPKRQKRH